MGFYKLYRIIKDFLKKPFRTAFIFIIIVIIISFFSSSAFAVETIIEHPYSKDGFYSVDPVNLVSHYQNGMLVSIMQLLLNIKESGKQDAQLKTLINDLKTNFYYVEFRPLAEPESDFIILLYNRNDVVDSPTVDTHIDLDSNYTSIPVVTKEVVCKVCWLSTTENKIKFYSPSTQTYKRYIPNFLVSTRNSDFDNFLNNFYTKSTNDLYNIMLSIKQSIDETNEFLKDDTKDDSVISTLPDNSSSSNDPTESGFSNIFDSFKNAFTDTSSYIEISLPIPFTDKKIWLDSNFLSKYTEKWIFGGGINFLDFMHMFWYFIFSLYIVKDVEKVVEKIKNGDIATSSDTNIKIDML